MLFNNLAIKNRAQLHIRSWARFYILRLIRITNYAFTFFAILATVLAKVVI